MCYKLQSPQTMFFLSPSAFLNPKEAVTNVYRAHPTPQPRVCILNKTYIFYQKDVKNAAKHSDLDEKTYPFLRYLSGRSLEENNYISLWFNI